MSLVLIPHPDIILKLRQIQNEFIKNANNALAKLEKPAVFPLFPLWLTLENGLNIEDFSAAYSKPDSKMNGNSSCELQKLKQVQGSISEITIDKIEIEREKVYFSCRYFLENNEFNGKIPFCYFNKSETIKAAINAATLQLPLKIKIFELGFADYKIPETESFPYRFWQTGKTVWVKKK